MLGCEIQGYIIGIVSLQAFAGNSENMGCTGKCSIIKHDFHLESRLREICRKNSQSDIIGAIHRKGGTQFVIGIGYARRSTGIVARSVEHLCIIGEQTQSDGTDNGLSRLVLQFEHHFCKGRLASNAPLAVFIQSSGRGIDTFVAILHCIDGEMKLGAVVGIIVRSRIYHSQFAFGQSAFHTAVVAVPSITHIGIVTEDIVLQIFGIDFGVSFVRELQIDIVINRLVA